MESFLKKHSTKLKFAALILMLGIPFLLFAAAAQGSLFQVKMLLGFFIVNMLLIMKFG